MPYSYVLTATIPASPEEIYETWLDSLGHSEMTGGPAIMSDQLGADVSAWGGYISGRNLELVPGARIVQSWRTSEFGEEHEDSIITLVLQDMGDGTLLTLEHSNVPDEQKSYEESGWQENYFEPMAAYFTARQEGEAEPPVAEAPPAAPRKRRAKGAPKPPAKRAVKRAKPTKRTAKTARKAKRAAPPRAKAAPKKRKSARKAAAAASRRRAKSGRRKSSRRKGR